MYIYYTIKIHFRQRDLIILAYLTELIEINHSDKLVYDGQISYNAKDISTKKLTLTDTAELIGMYRVPGGYLLNRGFIDVQEGAYA